MGESNTARICVPIRVERAIELRQAMVRASEAGDIIELRLDYLQGEELFKALRNLPALISSSPRPVIVTLRPTEQGGQRVMDHLTRTIFWGEHFLHGKPHVDFADIELDLVLLFMQREKEEGRKLLNWDRVICSHHDFKGLPSDLPKIYEKMAATPARILKIAYQGNSITDCIPVFHLLAQARREGRELIALAMGSEGVATRVLGPSHGAFLTYGAFDDAHLTAPGQLTATELRGLYRIRDLDPSTAVVGLAGSPVTHSVSPHIQNAAFKSLEINAVYLPLEVRDVAGFIRRMVHPRTREMKWKLRGLSITAPHKIAVMEYLDWIDPSAREIGSVNTVVAEGTELHGYNTDAAALLAPLTAKGLNLCETQCAVIGAGGAARSALWVLRREGAVVTVFARQKEKSKAVAEEFGAALESLGGASFENFDLVINATPLGTKGAKQNGTPALAGQLRGARFAYDLVYNPIETRFLREATEAGCDVLGGLQMLVEQAGEQFRLWTGREPPLEVMNEAAMRKLGESST